MVRSGREHLAWILAVFPAGPQPRPSTPSVPLPDLNREYPCQVFPAGPHVGRYGTKNVQKKVRKNVRQVCDILLANLRVCGSVIGAMPPYFAGGKV